MRSGSVVVTACDFESGLQGSNPEWEPIYYKASITAQGLPELSSLRCGTLGTRAAELHLPPIYRGLKKFDLMMYFKFIEMSK